MEKSLITHSSSVCYKTCPRKYFYQYIMTIRKSVESTPLRIGKAVHLGLDLWAVGTDPQESITRAVASYEVLPEWANTEELVYQWMIEREKVARLLSGYFWRWGEVEEKIIQSERAFEVDLLNPDTGRPSSNYNLAGRIDKIIETAGKRLAIKEHKTCSEDISNDSDYWLRLRIDQQISQYMTAARRLGYDVETVIYDVIRKPTIGPLTIPLLDEDGLKIVVDESGERVYLDAKGKSEPKPRQSGDSKKGWSLQTRKQTPQEYGERLTDDIAIRPEYYYAQREIPRLNSDLEEFEYEAWDLQKQIQEAKNITDGTETQLLA